MNSPKFAFGLRHFFLSKAASSFLMQGSQMGGAFALSLLAYSLMPASESALWNLLSVYAVMGALCDFSISATLSRLGIRYLASSSSDDADRVRSSIFQAAVVSSFCTATLGSAMSVAAMASFGGPLLNGVGTADRIWVFAGCGSYLLGQWIYYACCGPLMVMASLEDNVKSANHAAAVANTGRLLFGAMSFLLPQPMLGLGLSHMLGGAVAFVLLRKWVVVPGRQPVPEGFVRRLWREGWGPTWRTGLLGVSQFLISNILLLVLPSLASARTVGGFALAQKGVVTLAMLYAMSLQPYIPTITRLRALGEFEGIRSQFLPRIGAFFILSVVLAMAAYGPYWAFIGIVAKNLTPVAFIPFTLLAGTLLLDAHSSLHRAVYCTNNTMPFLLPLLLTSLLTAIVTPFALNAFGLTWSLIAQFLLLSLYQLWFPVFMNLADLQASFGGYLRVSLLSLTKFFPPIGFRARNIW